MRNIKLVIEYDGTAYHGWQSQQNALTIQDVLEEALRKLTGEHVRLVGAGRTDAGVHALGQTANFHTSSSIPPDRFSYALNSVIPKDIVIWHSCEVSESFHSRYDAKVKKYRYIILNSQFPSALMRNRAWHVDFPLDFESMKEALGYFAGTHDFSSFMASGSSVVNPVRTVVSTEICRDGEYILIDITADGFLYNMVRIIAGTLVEVGAGKTNPSLVPAIIGAKDRSAAGETAPAQGLYLVEVYYDNEKNEMANDLQRDISTIE